MGSPWEVLLQGPPGFSSAVIAMARHGLTPAGRGDRIWAALSQKGGEWARVVERLTSSVASIVVVDLPRQADTSSVSRSLEKGYYCTVLSLKTSDLGSFSARRRCLVVGFCSRSSCEVQDLSRKQCSSPPSLTMLPLAQNPSPECRIAGVVQLEPTIMTTGDRWLPHPAGHVMVEGVKELVHHPSGPACAFVGVEHPLKGFGGTLVLEARGTATRLESAEVVRAQGVEIDLYQVEVQQHGQDKAHLHLAREPGWQYAASIVGFLEAVPLDGKAGNCIDPADEEAHSQMAVWLQACPP